MKPFQNARVAGMPPGGAGAPAHASRRKNSSFQFFHAPCRGGKLGAYYATPTVARAAACSRIERRSNFPVPSTGILSTLKNAFGRGIQRFGNPELASAA